MATSRNLRGRLLKWSISYDKRVSCLKTWPAKLLYTWIIPSLDNLGRIEGEPRIIRSMTFPYEKITDTQIASWLQDIHNNGLLFWYNVNGERYLQCPTTPKNIFFREGQGRKRISDYPEPPENEFKEWLVRTRQDTAGHVGVDKDKDKDKDLDVDVDNNFSSFCKDVVKDWNALASGYRTLPQIQTLSTTRKEHLKARFKEKAFTENRVALLQAFRDSPWLRGEVPGQTGKPFKGGFDWLIENDNNYVKVLEGKYRDKPLEPQKPYRKYGRLLSDWDKTKGE